MLTQSEIMDRYGELRKFTAQSSGLEITIIEDHLREIVSSHIEALELLRSKGLLEK